jgi:hypothetical protein
VGTVKANVFSVLCPAARVVVKGGADGGAPHPEGGVVVVVVVAVVSAELPQSFRVALIAWDAPGPTCGC